MKPSLPRLRWTIERRLLAVLLATIACTSLYGWWLIQESAGQARARALQANAAAAANVAVTADGFIAATRSQLQALALAPAFQEQREPEMVRALRDLLTLHVHLVDLFTTDLDGKVLASAVQGAEPGDRVPHRYVLDAARRARPSVSGRLLSRVTGEPIIGVAVPLRDTFGRLIGTVGAEVSLRELQWNWASVGAQAGVSIIVVDQDGLVLVHPDLRLVSAPSRLPFVALAEWTSDRGTFEREAGGGGESLLVAYQRTRQAPFTVVVAAASSVAYGVIRDMLTRLTLTLVVTTGVALALGGLLTSMVTRPLQRLSREVSALSSDLASEGGAAAPDQADEVAQLSRAFDSLYARLRSHRQELTEARQSLEQREGELELLLHRVVRLQERERQRIALEIHDGIAQLVLSALHAVRAAGQELPASPAAAQARLAQVEQVLHEAYEEMRQEVLGLRPVQLAAEPLTSSIAAQARAFEERWRIPCRLDLVGRPSNPPLNRKLAVYRFVQEALANVGKHARASQVIIRLAFSPERLSVAVADDGVGFQPSEIPLGPHLGLLSLRERALSVGGSLAIESCPGGGTTVRLEVPLRGARARAGRGRLRLARDG